MLQTSRTIDHRELKDEARAVFAKSMEQPSVCAGPVKPGGGENVAADGRDSEGAEPVQLESRRTPLLRAGIGSVVVLIFWLDVLTPAGVVVPMFYVVPILLFTWAGRPWEPPIVAAVATLLTLLGMFMTPAGDSPGIALINRSLEIVGIWIAAGVVALHRVLVTRWTRQAVCDRAAIAASVRQRHLAEARLREQAALSHLGQLAAVVAHEVRNPLAGLRGSLQVLASRLPEAAGRDIATSMIERIDGLNAKVTDLLVYARPTEPKFRAVPVLPLVADAAVSARAATAAPTPVEVSGDSALVHADPEMLRPVLLNLLLNAYQADRAGRIEVRVSKEDDTCTISVMDRGPGIAADLRERVFEPFFTTKPAGTGLGLPVVKRLMELQGGSVRLLDRQGGGTAVALTLPCQSV